MTLAADTGLAAAVALQMGRAPRTPWRVAGTCLFGFPQVIASPSRLDDGTPFPTLYWLTCPHLTEAASVAESSGVLAGWAARAQADPSLAEALETADTELRTRRAEESDANDACAGIGIAGQSSPVVPKCLHARVAVALAGIDDPLGVDLLRTAGSDCENGRCESLLAKGPS